MEWTVAIGVDTHKAVHVAVALDERGVQLDKLEIETTPAGYVRLLLWAQGLGRPAVALEGAGGYGASLARFLEAAGITVFACERPHRRQRRRGKSDVIDAALAARRLLAGERLARPRGAGRREDLRVLLVERRSAIRARTAALNQLDALLVGAPERLRGRLGPLAGEERARACARLRPSANVLAAVLKRLGNRIERLAAEIKESERQLAVLAGELVPHLLAECGVGTICAAQLVVSSGNPARMRSEAAFAALAGTSPVQASSGQTHRHRLNRGGDRHLNCAFHVNRPEPNPPPPGNGRLLPTTPHARQDGPRSASLQQASPRPPLLPPSA